MIRTDGDELEVFPAWAGVILSNSLNLFSATCVPRMGGGDPGTKFVGTMPD